MPALNPLNMVACHVTYGSGYSDGAGNPHAPYSGWAFDKTTLSMVQVSGTWSGALLDPKPADVYLATGDIIFYTCAGTTCTFYRYQRTGETFYTTTETDSVYCGYTPPNTQSCLLTIVSAAVANDQVVIACSNYVGPLQYSIDGGNTRQTSPQFTDLSAGSYTATVYDLGASLPGCHKTQAFTISDQQDPNAPPVLLAPLPVFCFAGNPVVVTATAVTAFQYLIFEVYCEEAHGSGRFNLVFSAKRRSDAQRGAAMEVSEVLRAQLQPELFTAAGWHTLTQPLRNWFVRVAPVLAATGRAGNWTTSSNSVVLLGGLAAEPLMQSRSFFEPRVRASRVFHTWQPLKKRVGRQHVEVLQLLMGPGEYDVHVYAYRASGNAVAGSTGVVAYVPPAAPAAPAAMVAPPPVLNEQKVHLAQLVLNLSSYPSTVTKLLIRAEKVDRSQALGTDESGTQLTPIPLDSYTRQLDIADDAQPRQLIYENSFGVFDTLACYGHLSAKLPVEAAPVQAFLPLAPGLASTQQERSWPATGPAAPLYTLNTGWLTPAWLEYLQELVQPGRQVYEYVAGQLRPIVLTLKELATYDEDGETLPNATLEYRHAIRNEFYTDYARNTNRNGNAGAGW